MSSAWVWLAAARTCCDQAELRISTIEERYAVNPDAQDPWDAE